MRRFDGDKRNHTLMIWETLVFIIGWIIIFLLGADFPPPVGFWKVIAGILIVAIIQWYYMRWMLPNIRKRRSLTVTVLLFTCLGALAALLAAQTSGQEIRDSFEIWITIIMSVGALYGLLFWTINRLICKQNR
ncbi:MAG: hypothetical protein ACI4ET_03645 [Bilifractor sp.]